MRIVVFHETIPVPPAAIKVKLIGKRIAGVTSLVVLDKPTTISETTAIERKSGRIIIDGKDRGFYL